MKKSTSKKTVSNEASKASVSKTSSSSNKNDSTKTMLIVVLVISVLNLLLLGTMVFSDSNSEINEKVTRLDNFFASNVPEYGGEGSAEIQPQGVAPDTTTVSEPSIENRPMLGSADAPITIVEYSDFECPFCKRFADQTYEQLKEEYINTGKAKLVFKDFPLDFHPLAKPAAIASKCVYKLGGDDAFFSFHDLIFKYQSALSEDNLRSWASQVGVGTGNYDECIVDPAIGVMVDEDFAEGSALGVSGTPSFVINGQLLVGAQPFSAFKQVIDAQLN